MTLYYPAVRVGQAIAGDLQELCQRYAWHEELLLGLPGYLALYALLELRDPRRHRSERVWPPGLLEDKDLVTRVEGLGEEETQAMYVLDLYGGTWWVRDTSEESRAALDRLTELGLTELHVDHALFGVQPVHRLTKQGRKAVDLLFHPGSTKRLTRYRLDHLELALFERLERRRQASPGRSKLQLVREVGEPDRPNR